MDAADIFVTAAIENNVRNARCHSTFRDGRTDLFRRKVYQGGGKGVPSELIAHLAQVSHDGLLPDRTLVFDCPYEVARERLERADRKPDRFEREDREFFERVRQAYLALARSQPGRIRVIDAAGTLDDIKKKIEVELSDI